MSRHPLVMIQSMSSRWSHGDWERKWLKDWLVIVLQLSEIADKWQRDGLTRRPLTYSKAVAHLLWVFVEKQFWRDAHSNNCTIKAIWVSMALLRVSISVSERDLAQSIYCSSLYKDQSIYLQMRVFRTWHFRVIDPREMIFYEKVHSVTWLSLNIKLLRISS